MNEGLPGSSFRKVAVLLFQIACDLSAELQQRYFTHFGIVLGRKDTFFRIQQTLLGFAHLNARQIPQQVAFFRYFVVLFGRDEILSFQVEQADIVSVCLPEIAQVSAQPLFQLVAGELRVTDCQTGVLFSLCGGSRRIC